MTAEHTVKGAVQHKHEVTLTQSSVPDSRNFNQNSLKHPCVVRHVVKRGPSFSFLSPALLGGKGRTREIEKATPTDRPTSTDDDDGAIFSVEWAAKSIPTQARDGGSYDLFSRIPPSNERAWVTIVL